MPDENLSFESLAARRRSMYVSLSRPDLGGVAWAASRWISTAAMVAALGGLALYQHGQVTPGVDSRISDAQLAQEVSQLSQGQEDPTTQPLQELFE